MRTIGIPNRNSFILNDLGQYGIHGVYQKWVEESLSMLAENGLITLEDNRYSAQAADLSAGMDRLWLKWNQSRKSWENDPTVKNQIELLEITIRALPDILCGKIPATDVLFPNSSMKLVEGVYQNNPVADYFNAVTAETVAAFLKERTEQEHSAQIRILEIGAGTGGTSSMIFKKLKPFIQNVQEYTFTDVSRAFLLHAQKKYGPGTPYLNYKIFNAEHPVGQQGILPGSYDIVVAANVLHATKNIKKTLRNIKAALARNGLLVLNEISRRSLFTHLTFGLLEGWWQYDDPKLRIPGCPGLLPSTWKEILEGEGFHSAFFPAESEHSLGQQVVVAVSDGVVHQKRNIMSSTKTAQIERYEPVGSESLGKGRNPADESQFKDRIRAVIVETLSCSLKIDSEQIDITEPFADYGVDSITGISFINSINSRLHIHLSTTSIFAYSTVERLTAYIVTDCQPEISNAPAINPYVDLYGDQAVNAMNNGRSVNHTVHPVHGGHSRKPWLPLKPGDSLQVVDNHEKTDSVAIIGMSGRFAKSGSVKELWENIANGNDLVEKITRWNLAAYFQNRDAFCNCGGYLERIDRFDPAFFNISGNEASFMDPQQRIFLEESWKALEDAGYAGEDVKGRRCGVYVGCGTGDYGDLFPDDLPPQAFWGNSSAVIPSRISYYMNLLGPAIAIDTSCSSSLVAVHLACRGLLDGEAEMALAGGVFVQATPRLNLFCERAGMLSHTGKCHTFDEAADGFVPGEGAGVLVLKRLQDAISAGDHIYGVIRGSGINQDGTTNGITAPSQGAQESLEESVYREFHIDPEDIQMMEAHGTGTKLGDPIEVEALTRAFSHFTGKKGYCAIGSIKTNLGHCTYASGIAGIIKILLSLKYKKIPPSLNFNTCNANIDFKNSPFFVNTELKDWEVPQGKRRCAAISGFGFNGTNAHLVIEEAPDIQRVHSEKPGYLLVLSARSQRQLKDMASHLAGFCEAEPATDCGNISYTLILGRRHLKHRLACVAHDTGELGGLLRKWLETGKHARVYSSNSNENPYGGRFADRTENHCIEHCRSASNRDEYLENLEIAARLFAAGCKLPYDRLFDDEGYSRIALPTYSFDDEAYWLPETKKHGAVAVKTDSVKQPDHELPCITPPVTGSDEDITLGLPEDRGPEQIMTFEEIWQPASLSVLRKEKPGVLICFLSGNENRRIVRTAIKSDNPDYEVIYIGQDDGYAKHSPTEYTVRAGDPESCAAAFDDIRTKFKKVDAVLYMWPVGRGGMAADYACIVSIIKAIGICGLTAKKLLLAGQYRSGLERCYIESWEGFGRSLKTVLPSAPIEVVISQLKAADSTDGFSSLWHDVCAELLADYTQVVLYAEGKRYLKSIRQTVLRQSSTGITAGGTYLITGGCGGLGSIFAEHLAKNRVANLILTGRSPLTDEKRACIGRLEKLGTQVLYIQADASSLEAMRAAKKAANERFGPINGVIHAAGIEGRKLLFEQKDGDFQKILNPKIEGAIVLDQIFSDTDLDFTVYFSSSSAILGDFGTCGYAIANRFLTAYAEYRNTNKGYKGTTYAINWPVWKNGGMRVGDADATKLYLKTSGQRLLENQDGTDIFDRVIAQDKTQCAVFFGRPRRIQELLGLAGREQAGNTQAYSAILPGKGRNTEIKGFSLEQCIEWDFKKIISGVLGTKREKLDNDMNFADFGFDSLSLSVFAEKLTAYYKIQVIPSVFYAYSTIGRLLQYFLSEHGQELGAFYQESAEINQKRLEVDSGSKETKRKPCDFAVSSGRNVCTDQPEPIAIIGMSGRFPGARSVDEMWTVIENGENVVTATPPERIEYGMRPGIRCGWMPGVGEFDPGFFGISPREASTMDPRQRILMQETWKALEDAGYGPSRMGDRKIGMFVGAETGDYQLLTGMDVPITANHPGVLSGRLSYFLNLTGSNMTINTACSSGLVAAHQACLSLRENECDAAVAAGVNLILSPETFDMVGKAGMLSETGKCSAFDRNADGMVPGEAVAAVVLKRLSRAEADGDRIYAMITASGINNDGKTNGITAPSGIAQTNLLTEVYGKYKVDPEEIEYIVAHGTGTKLGDPIEANALCDAFRSFTDKKRFCAVTSVKPNLGHTFAASGLVSLLCLVQSLRYETIPASANFEQINGYIDWKESPFYINTKNRPWKDSHGKRRSGAVSSFGMSGTNAHMVVQSYKQKESGTGGNFSPCFLLALSAETPEELNRRVRDLLEYIPKRIKNSDLPGLSYTLGQGRHHFGFRCAAVVRDVDDAVSALKSIMEAENLPNIYRGCVKKSFTGQTITKQYIDELIQNIRNVHGRERYHEILSALAELYCQGYNIFQTSLFTECPHIVTIPTYPFSREWYWVKSKGGVKGPASGAVAAGTAPAIRYEATEPVKIEESGTTEYHPQMFTLCPLENGINPAANCTPEKPRFISLCATTRAETDSGSRAEQGSAVEKSIPDLECLEKELLESLAEALATDVKGIDKSSNFVDMGLDSIIGVEWIHEINRRYGTGLTANMIYRYPTVRKFSQYLGEKIEEGRADGEKIKVLEAAARVVIYNDADEDSGGNAGSEDFPAKETDQEQNSVIVSGQPTFSRKISADSGRSLKKELAESMTEALGMEPEEIDLNSDFIDIGMDSVIGVEWIRQINTRYGTDIPASEIYSHPNLDAFAGYLKTQMERGKNNTASNLESGEPNLSELLNRVYMGTLGAAQADELFKLYMARQKS